MTGLWASYYRFYDFVCGVHPDERPWHYQWLPGNCLYRDLRDILPELDGRILDVGCGKKPYRKWCTKASEYVGIDLDPEFSDFNITPGEPWPLDDSSFDFVLCTQVLEHADNIDLVLDEILRVLRCQGRLILSVPFIYNEHGAPHDFRRFSASGITALLQSRFRVMETRRQGRIGTTCASLILNWIEIASNHAFPARLLKGLLFPVWLLFCLGVNVLALLVDSCDPTQAFYQNVLVIAEKTPSSRSE